MTTAALFTADPLAPGFEASMEERGMNGLDEVAVLTSEMRRHQESITLLGRRRRAVVLRLRDQKVTYREIAAAMGVSEMAVYKVIRGDL
jgi:DNA-directed RNA polymerase specialized sigma24 family protein